MSSQQPAVVQGGGPSGPRTQACASHERAFWGRPGPLCPSPFICGVIGRACRSFLGGFGVPDCVSGLWLQTEPVSACGANL